MKLQQAIALLAEKGIKAQLVGEPSFEVYGVASLMQAQAHQLSFFNDSRRLTQLQATQAGCVLLKSEYLSSFQGQALVVDDPYYAYACLASMLHPRPFQGGLIASTAIIAENCKIPKSVQIQPGVVIQSNVQLGEGCFIGAGCVLDQGVVLGDGVYLYPKVTILQDCILGNEVTVESGTVIGGQGFGNAQNQGRWQHIPQLGRVVIGDRVWIGNNCAVDRGTLEDTVIADDCVIDNLVHIAHNVKIGRGTALAGQVGFAGSTQVGEYCTMGGQVGVAGHLQLADHTHFYAKSGITHNIKQPGIYAGFPAVPVKDWQKSMVKLKGLDKLSQKIKHLELELSELHAKMQTDQSSDD